MGSMTILTQIISFVVLCAKPKPVEEHEHGLAEMLYLVYHLRLQASIGVLPRRRRAVGVTYQGQQTSVLQIDLIMQL
jgi:hypothetical protein